jgi:hypothetical protein
LLVFPPAEKNKQKGLQFLQKNDKIAGLDVGFCFSKEKETA